MYILVIILLLCHSSLLPLSPVHLPCRPNQLLSVRNGKQKPKVSNCQGEKTNAKERNNDKDKDREENQT
jgi:hypothetical protein